jgi:hypothetical protein
MYLHENLPGSFGATRIAKIDKLLRDVYWPPKSPAD